MQAMFLRAPYRLEPRDPSLTETQYQFSNWYHFCWLSGDDVTQSLVHNIDRMSWIMREQTPEWAFGLGGRSASFGDVYGDMFDHHTAVYEYKNGTRLYALCRTQANTYGNAGDIIMGSKGQCYLDQCKITGATNWRYDKDIVSPYLVEQAALIEAIKSGNPINSGSYMVPATMIGVMGQIACYTGQPITYAEASQADVEFGPSPDTSNFETPPPSLPDATGNYPLPIPGLTEYLKR